MGSERNLKCKRVIDPKLKAEFENSIRWAFSLSLSLSLVHTHTHTHALSRSLKCNSLCGNSSWSLKLRIQLTTQAWIIIQQVLKLERFYFLPASSIQNIFLNLLKLEPWWWSRGWQVVSWPRNPEFDSIYRYLAFFTRDRNFKKFLWYWIHKNYVGNIFW